MSNELKPCPFCGSIPQLLQAGLKALEIKCKCPIRYKQKVKYHSLEWLEEKMIEFWNTRSSGAQTR